MITLSRKPWTLLLAVLVALMLATPSDAWAKKKKGKKGKKGNDVELIGVKSMDKVFRQIKNLDGTVDTAQKSRRKGKTNVNTAMGLSPQTSLKQAVRELNKSSQSTIKVVKKGKAPTLKAAPDAPKEVQKGIEAVNQALDSYTSAIETLASVPKEANELVRRCKDFPGQLKGEVMNNPMKAVTMFKSIKTVKNNIGIASKLPKRATRVTKNLTKDVNLVVTTFGGAALDLM